MTIITHPTYDQIHSACIDIAGLIIDDKFEFDIIVGLARGGMLPALILSHQLDCPVVVPNYSSKSGVGDNRNHDNVLPNISGKRILVVDDISDTGKTLVEVYEHYCMYNTVHTLALYYKEQPKGMVPTFYWQKIPTDAEWIIFPFETQ